MEFKFIKPGKIMFSKDELIRFLDIDGKLTKDGKTNEPKLSKDELIKAYKFMVLSRRQDEYMTQLQRQGRMLTFAPNFGEEALQVASAMALRKDDWFVPAFRSNATMLYMGMPVKNQMLYWNGNERGSVTPEGINLLPVNIPIATQCSHAAGIAYAAKLMGKKIVSMSFIGNGGTAEGEFYEAINTSAIWKWPSVFCVNNNQWSISTPEHLETGSETIAAKAAAAGIPGVRVDGNDLLASYAVIKEAVEFAREGNGPVVVEFVTWRQGPHTTSDNPRVYRTKEQEEENEKWEPMHRIEAYLKSKKYLTDAEKDKIWDDALEQVKEAYQQSLTELDVDINEVFDYTYESLTPELQEQKAEAMAYYASKENK
ncbi:pyruvate dehydrogenase (acetyl-transferring) E1 component subunit alpha [Mycoplasmopsis edwardii]|uniref:Pyruvate dehydrogenase (Acetyl-transferring) E1 component subunit alpha n=1 Tax=Mycoplasmopsis edwardii TaxID=53558 RepID=A0ACD4PHW8_9BACT|nr:pyruvate dehydrogenase (acetyl-transferring) E1 component subunit alpha [Mycoplasmopsis edwardii]WBP84277.1 pyruvate dehydrogenase (acetyl-transferring) E1 component subunit alpha [Mycoplasmopsis edwardii]